MRHTLLSVTLHIFCFSLGREGVAEGSSRFYLDFLTYKNPKDVTADGKDCDFSGFGPQNLCDHIFQFCVSSKGRT